MDTLFHKIGSAIIGAYIAVSSFFHPQIPVDTPTVGTTIPTVVAVFQTSLAASIATTDTSMTLVSGTDKAGNAISGYTCFNLDEGTAVEEFVCGTASSTAITGMIRGLDPVDGVTERSTLKKRHGRGASVKITNFPQLAIVSRALNGTVALPNALFYSTNPCTAGSASTTLCSKAYTDQIVNNGAATATNLVAGISKLSVSAASANNPIVVGDNDTRVPPINTSTMTAGQVSALAGSSSTPSSTNKYITQSDVATTTTTNAIVRASSTGYIDPSFLTGSLIPYSMTAAEPITVGQPVSAYYYQSDGGVTFDAKAVANGGAGAATIAFTVANQPNRILVVFLSTAGGSDFGGNTVSYNGVSMTRQQTVTGGSFQRSSVYTLVAPATGSNNLTFTVPGSGAYEVAIFSYYNASQGAIDNSTTTVASSQAVTGVAQGLVEVTGVNAASAPTGGANMQNNQQTTSGQSVLHFFTGDSGIVVGNLSFTTSATGGTNIFAVGIAPATAVSFGYVVKSSAASTANAANMNKYQGFMGFARATVSTSSVVSIQTDGVVTGLSGLTPLVTTYLSDTAGSLSASAGSNSKKIGTSLSTTTLQIKHDN